MSDHPNEPPPKYEPPKGEYPPPYPTGDYPPQPQPWSDQPPYQTGQPYSPYPPQQPYPGMMPNYQSTASSNPQQQQVIVITNQIRPGPNPLTVQCPNCQHQIVTTTSHEAGALTWISVGVLVLFGCWLGCCLIPFCINDLQDVRHSCPNCHQHIATYSRI